MRWSGLAGRGCRAGSHHAVTRRSRRLARSRLRRPPRRRTRRPRRPARRSSRATAPVPRRRRRFARAEAGVLRQRSPEAILAALTAGGMRPQGGRLTGAERRAVAGTSAATRSAAISRARPSAGAARGARSAARRGASPLERLVAVASQHPFPTDGAGGTHRGTRVRAVAEVGLRLSGRDVRMVAADGCARTAVRRQPERHGLFARREDRLHLLDVHREDRRAHGARRTRSVRGRGMRVLRRHGRERLRARRRQRRELWSRQLDAHPLARITGSPTCAFDGCSCRSPRLRKPRRRRPATRAARFAAA